MSCTKYAQKMLEYTKIKIIDIFVDFLVCGFILRCTLHKPQGTRRLYSSSRRKGKFKIPYTTSYNVKGNTYTGKGPS